MGKMTRVTLLRPKPPDARFDLPPGQRSGRLEVHSLQQVRKNRTAHPSRRAPLHRLCDFNDRPTFDPEFEPEEVAAHGIIDSYRNIRFLQSSACPRGTKVIKKAIVFDHGDLLQQYRPRASIPVQFLSHRPLE